MHVPVFRLRTSPAKGAAVAPLVIRKGKGTAALSARARRRVHALPQPAWPALRISGRPASEDFGGIEISERGNVKIESMM